MDNYKIRFGKQSGKQLVLVIPNCVNNKYVTIHKDVDFSNES